MISRLKILYDNVVLWIYPSLAAVVVIALCVFAAILGMAAYRETVDWISHTENPTERGCIYISVAIVVHALFPGRRGCVDGTK